MSRITDTIKRIFGLQSQIQTMVQPSPSVVVNAGTQVLRAVKPHFPMIKFRTGSGGHVTGHSCVSPTANPIARTPKDSTVVESSGVSKEDWHLPSRYRRRPISKEEVDCINGGGAP